MNNGTDDQDGARRKTAKNRNARKETDPATPIGEMTDGDFFDDCDICMLMKEKKHEGSEPSMSELLTAFSLANARQRNASAEQPAKKNRAEKQTAIKRPDRPNEIFQFKVTMNDIKPAIWRRIRVPAGFSFGELSLAIIDAFGRLPGCHLHGYRIWPQGKTSRDFLSIGPPNPDGDIFDRSRDERHEFIADHFGKTIKQCVFTYDFGDGWDHTVLFEGAFPADAGVKYPQLLGGKNATPPEDCGGSWGYAELLKILKNPKHPEHEEKMEWLCLDHPDDFDPTEFDPTEVEFGTREQYRKFLEGYDPSKYC